MWYREEHVYDLSSRRIRLNNPPGRVSKVYVDHAEVYPRRSYEHRSIERFKVNDRSVFIYPLRYNAIVSVEYEESMNMDRICQMASDFWLKTGKSPTHLLLSVEDQNMLTATFAPKERVQTLTVPPPGKMATVCIAPDVFIDLIPVSALRSGHHNDLILPKMIRLED